MASALQSRCAVTCAENIAILNLLHNVPAQPSSNPVMPIQSRTSGYHLPFETERSLATILAFLAAVNDDPNRIPAICIQEVPNADILNVLLAVNKSTADAGAQHLRTIKAGFDKIFTLLSQVNDPKRVTNIENEIFTKIIELCHERILSRLRFKTKRRDSRERERVSFRNALHAVVEYFKRGKSKEAQKADQFVERSKEVLAFVTKWTQHQVPERLEALVEGIHHLRQVEGLSFLLLEAIPNRDIGPSGREHLLNTIRKVARYRDVARMLYRAAKKDSLVKRMRAVIVDLPNCAFRRIQADEEYNPEIQSAILRTNELGERNITRICNLLGTTQQAINKKFAEQAKKTLKESKIHAEIQLLYYCEFKARGKQTIPRVVCSSKRACWLCNEFILLYGKVYTPNSHGRLYTGWRLPALNEAQFDDIAGRMNRLLQQRIVESMRLLLARGARTTYPPPMESTLSTVAWSVSTSKSFQIRNDAEINLMDDIAQQHLNPSDLTRTAKDKDHQASTTGGNLDSSVAIDESVKETLPARGDEVDAVTIPQSSSTSIESLRKPSIFFCQDGTSSNQQGIVRIGKKYANGQPSDHEGSNKDPDNAWPRVHTTTSRIGTDDMPSTSSFEIIQGETETGEVSKGTNSRAYIANDLTIQIEYAANFQRALSGSPRPKQIYYAVQWLTRDEEEEIRSRDTTIIVDVVALEGEVSYNTDERDSIYLATGGSLVKLTMRERDVEVC
ncbi:hypothetical protein F5Y19DRAFT_492640 [Xylariaceae sp. FL1651]|nr:hypothetical protein F5Y19DRAFT_492640 [Xylariaceae sp. FL1651]